MSGGAAPLAQGEAQRRVLHWVAAHPPGVSLETIANWTDLTRKQIVAAAGKLVARGWVERPGPGLYKATDAGRAADASGAPITSGPNGPTRARRHLADTYRTRLWRSMRIRRAFTLAEIAADAARDEAEPLDDARRYARQLAEAGYLAPSGGSPRAGASRFRLVRDPGPVAPVWSKVRGEMRDFNPVRTGGSDGRS